MKEKTVLTERYSQEELDAVAGFEIAGPLAFVTIHEKELDSTTSPIFGEVLRRAIDHKDVLMCNIDMNSVTKLSTFALRELTTAQVLIDKKKKNKGVGLINVDKDVFNLLQMSGVADMLRGGIVQKG